MEDDIAEAMTILTDTTLKPLVEVIVHSVCKSLFHFYNVFLTSPSGLHIVSSPWLLFVYARFKVPPTKNSHSLLSRTAVKTNNNDQIVKLPNFKI